MLTPMNPPNVIEGGDYGHPVLINWDIIDKCQFECTYCYAADFNKNEFFEKNMYHNTWKMVLHRLSKLEFDYILDIRGGEPTLHPNFLEIISALESYERCKKISISTNMGGKLKTYKQLDTPNTKIELHMSYHVEYPKQYLRKVLALVPMIEHMITFAEVMLYPKTQYYQQLLDIIASLEQHKIQFGVVLIRPTKYWDGIYDPGFYETFDYWLNDLDRNKYATPIKHLKDDGTIEYVDEPYMLKNKFHYNGFKCQQMAYNVSMNGDFINVCTGMRLPITAKEADFKKVVTCPNTVPCYCFPMLLYKKIHPLHYVKSTKSN